MIFAAVGSRTTLYNLQDHGDPNADVNPEEDDTEVQYHIKWKLWAHIHNTWESERTLNEQNVNGLKKLENFVKMEDELAKWYVFYTLNF